MAGTQVGEIDATLLTLKGIYDRPVWSEQFRESAVACQSDADLRRGEPNVGNVAVSDVRDLQAHSTTATVGSLRVKG